MHSEKIATKHTQITHVNQLMVSDTVNSKWGNCLNYIKDNISAEQYNSWFTPLVPVKYEAGENAIYLSAPSQFFIEHIEQTYIKLLSTALRHEFGDDVKLSYNVRMVQNEPASDVVIAERRKSPINPFETAEFNDIDPQLNVNNCFENYCGSESNKLAVTVAMTIATDPSIKTFSPLFLFGPTGVGKTHLIQATGLKIKEKFPATRVLYLTARVFESQYTTAVATKHINDFIAFYQSIDVLILDDVQEFAGKPGTQNTFFHIFNHLHQNKKQLILSSDCPPSELDGMEPRLLSRFKWGMSVELSKPDYTLRRGVLMMRASQDGLSISNEVLDYIARNVTDSVRELEGIVVSLLAHATMLNQDITVDLAKTVISNCVRMSKRQVTFEKIAETVASHYNIDTDLLYGKSRKREISDARQLVMYFAKKDTQLSSTNIGLRLQRNHATVLHACKQIEQRISVEKKLQDDISKIENELHS